MFRLIARLDIKGVNLVKGIHLEGLRVLGRPRDFARRYSRAGWELLYIDIVASLYGRNQLEGLLLETSSEIHIPITVGGGIGGVADATRLFKSGADKIAVNTKAVERPQLIDEIAAPSGSQAISLSVEAIRRNGFWEATVNSGRDRTGLDVRRWVDEGIRRGAGEILLTSVDMDGTRKGFDLELIRVIGPQVEVPVIAAGGCGSLQHIEEARQAGADGVALASVLHYGILTQEQIDERFTQSDIQAKGTGEGGRIDAGCDSGV